MIPTAAIGGAVVRLLRLCDPWGNHPTSSALTWRGDWSRFSPLWDALPAGAVDAEGSGVRAAPADCVAGAFWMSVGDVRRHIDGGGVCLAEAGRWYDYRVRCHWEASRPDLILEVYVTGAPVTVFITVSQADRRRTAAGHKLAGQGSSHDDYFAVLLSVCEACDVAAAEFRASRSSAGGRADAASRPGSTNDSQRPPRSFSPQRDVVLRVVLEPSRAPYLVVPRVHSSSSGRKAFTLGFVSSTAVDGRTCAVRFKRPAHDWGWYRNYARFGYDAASVPSVSAEFQRWERGVGGAPETAVGCAF
jgi:hypothetical protein